VNVLSHVDFSASSIGANPPPWVGWALLAIAGLLLGGLAVAWLRRRARVRRARSRAPQAAGPMICPACRRAYPMGTLFCPTDATRLRAAAEGSHVGRGGKCPRCRRAFEAGMRFCPMDAEELLPLPPWPSGGAAHHDESWADHLIGGQGKICPVCAGRYDLEALFCGRDAAELVTVN
jgi:hypothetical protein